VARSRCAPIPMTAKAPTIRAMHWKNC
jgi:hypothetical protein